MFHEKKVEVDHACAESYPYLTFTEASSFYTILTQWFYYMYHLLYHPENSLFCPQSVFLFCIVLTKNKIHFPNHH
jgi:hypothetical protein